MSHKEIVRVAAEKVVSSSVIYSAITEEQKEEATNYAANILANHSESCALGFLDN